MLKGFKYIADANSNVLILGTFPGEESRKTMQYYGNKRNQFWKIIYTVFNEQYNSEICYDEKIKFLLDHNIALWDVIDNCLVDGSLDSKIKNPVFNDIQKLINEYPKIQKIFCNGQMVYKLLEKQNVNIFKKILPSSSPTNTMKYDIKLMIWKESILN
jgi:hypoxanthine-DNA glycosylase